jgi:hypothetical protein
MKKTITLLLIAILVSVVGCTDGSNPSSQGGEITFKFQMVDKDEQLKEWDITTEEANLAEALLAEELIEGTVGDFGLFVTAVNGITLEESNAYWELFIDGESAMVGVSSVKVEEGVVYAFKYSTFS